MVEKPLSLREKQIVALIKEAKANKIIAYELHLSVGTIKRYNYLLFKKIGMSNRTEVAMWALHEELKDKE
jgi:DNA-binding NarL/FixJ family response regulator